MMRLIFSFVICVSIWSAAQAQFGGITVVNTNTNIFGHAHGNSHILPPGPLGPIVFKEFICNWQNEPLNNIQGIKALPNSNLALYCVHRAVESDICISTRGITATGCEVGASNLSAHFQWQVFSAARHRAEMFTGYNAFDNSTGDYEITLVIPGPANSQGTLFYSLNGFLAAFSKSEGPQEDGASVANARIELAGVDLMAAGSFPTGFASGLSPTGNQILGGGRQISLTGQITFTANVPFTIEAGAQTAANVTNPGIMYTVPGSICSPEWVDAASATFFGNLTLTLDPTLLPQLPQALPVNSYFSLDIGSASELSDPFASGTEYFDPGDAYRIKGPLLPPGGVDGTLDDGSFLGFDMAPSAPDAAVPSLTAAPIGSGLPLASLIPNYFNLDGLARLDFDLQGLAAGQVPPVFPLGASQCVYRPFYVYVSFDEDSPPHYSSVMPSVPANSTPSGFPGEIFGSTINKDEIVELFKTPLYLGGFTIATGVAHERDIHERLAPNPGPLGPHPENDDVNALDLGYNAACDRWYISVSHEATGINSAGTTLDPATIYRVVPGTPGPGLIPAVTGSELGLPPGTDVNAFDFVRVYNPAINPAGDMLGVLFSVDADNPMTPFPIDESGGLDPGELYISYRNGINYPFDSAYVFQGNVDAISVLPTSIAFGGPPVTCNSYNFQNPPSNLNLTINPNSVTLSWAAYPFATQCVVSGNNILAANDVNFTVQAAQAPSSNSFTIPMSQLQSGATYRARVQCQCSGSIQSPYTGYLFFTVPSQQGGDGTFEFFAEGSENADELMDAVSFNVYPNPANDFVVIEATTAVPGMATISVFNTLGQQVASERIDGSNLDSGYRISTSNFAAGWYAVQIAYGDRIETKSLRIEK